MSELVVEVRIPSQPRRLKLVRALVRQVASENGCSDACAQDIVIAVDEACQNVIRHAYRGADDGEIQLRITRDGPSLAFNLVDFAATVDKSIIRPRALDELRPGGLGTHFIVECMDEVEYIAPPAGVGNELRMVKRIE